MKTSISPAKPNSKSKPGFRKSFKPKNTKFKPNFKTVNKTATENKTRKDLRKEKRKDKKAKKHLFLLAKVGKVPVAPVSDGPKKKRRQNPKAKRRNAKLRKQNSGRGSESESEDNSETEGKGSRPGQGIRKDEDHLKKQMEETRRKRLLEDNEEEERHIKSLQKKLKLNKKAVIPESFRVDGLDYLLEFCDKLDSNKKSDGNKKKSAAGGDDGSENDADEAMEMNSNEGNSDLGEEDDELGSEFDGDGSSDQESDAEGEDENVVDSGESDTGLDDDQEVEGQETNVEDDSESIPVSVKKPKKEEYWEDIYGRTRDKEGNVVDSKGGVSTDVKTAISTGKYVPPAKRGDQTNRDKIKKSLKGLLNRLSESNMHSIANQIEDLYMRNSRNEMNETLLELISAVLIGPVLSTERIVLEHVMLIAILHANVGTEIGAFFIQSFVQRFHKLYDEVQSLEDNNKELENLALLYSFMYHFKIVDCCLIYDELNFLADRFTPKDIELILTILKTVGFRLRKDDPASLKSLILILQQKATSSKSSNQSSRVKFMLEILLAIRNNNMSKIPNYDPSFGEHLLKVIKAHLHKGNYVSELKISRQDLLNADTKGKWWIVGSAWTNTADSKSDPKQSSTASSLPKILEKDKEKLLAKAKAQGMNTDTRRNIFCILMTAEDYLDAFEKLVHLGLKNQLEREIIHVIVFCCLQEKKFNPYYAYLASKFCQLERRFVLTIQYTLWDRLKDFGSQEELHLDNMSQFLIHLINDRSLPLTVLKVIDFADMSKGKLTFLRKTLAGILLQKNTDNIQEVFLKIGLSEKLTLFRESLKLFMGHFMLKQNNKVLTAEGDSLDLSFDTKTLVILKERVKLAERAMSIGLNKVQF